MLGLSNVYNCRPSTLLDIADPYTAYCFDEACAFINGKMAQDEQPQFIKKYKSFKELYSKYE